MAACYGCGKGTFTFAGSYCTECRPPREDQTQPTNARGSRPYNAYMPTAANERDAIVAYLDVQCRKDWYESNKCAKMDLAAFLDTVVAHIKAGRHTK